MSMQDKILSKTDKFRRKIYNEKLKYSGNETRIIRLSIEEDRFGDETLIKIINHEEIILNMTSLEEIPLSRLRQDLSNPITTSTQSLFLYDILPIVVEPKTNADLEVGDILIKKMYKDSFTENPFFLTLRVMEPLGDFSPLSLIKTQFQCAPYINAFSQEIIDIINSY